MARGRKPTKPMLTLEQQLAQHTAERPSETGDTYDAAYSRMWNRRRVELLDDIRRRDNKPLRDVGRDRIGKFGVSPHAARGHKVEVAPKILGKELPKDSNFPERLSTQRVIDRLKGKTISVEEWKVANTLRELWDGAITGDRLTAAWSSVTGHASTSTDHLVVKRMDAAITYLGLIALIPKRCQGVVVHVVINDWELSDWGIRTAKSERARRRQAAKRLSQGLQALIHHLGR